MLQSRPPSRRSLDSTLGLIKNMEAATSSRVLGFGASCKFKEWRINWRRSWKVKWKLGYIVVEKVVDRVTLPLANCRFSSPDDSYKGTIAVFLIPSVNPSVASSK